MIIVNTLESCWNFHYEYKGNNIDVFIDKNMNPERAMDQATWAIHNAICDLDINTTNNR